MKNLLFVLFLLPILLTAQVPIKRIGITKVEKIWEKYVTDYYSINRISTWETADNKQVGTEFIFFIADIFEDPNFRENINLIVQDLGGNDIDLAGFSKISEDQIKTLMNNAKILESSKVKGDAFDYHRIIFTGDQGIYKLKFEQRYILHNKKAYILTYTAQQADFDHFLNDVNKSFNSFNFLN